LNQVYISLSKENILTIALERIMHFNIKFKYGNLKVGEIYWHDGSYPDALICKIMYCAYYSDILNYRFEGESITYNGKE